MPTTWPETGNKASAQGAAPAEIIPDAPHRNIVDRLAPESLKPWLRLMRADRPVGAWLLMWPCWWSVALAARYLNDFKDVASTLPYVWLLALFAIGSFAMRSAGCVYNDILDRDIDARVARTQSRPLASGRISVKAAFALIVALCLVGLAVLIQFNVFAIALGFASVGIVLVYPLMKRVTFWPQAVLGLAFSWGALMGWAAIFGSLGVAPILLYVAAVAWTIGYDTIYAHQDKEDDAVIGLKSTALRFGKNTPAWLSLFYGITIVGITLAGAIIGAGYVFYAGMALAAGHLVWQIATLDMDDGQNCLDRFRSNHLFGAIVFLALILDMIPLPV
ncbi:4-hydroxybenzoate octaprenyltransferase [Rhodomicrobium lacus]|uniref:4-hydroxybenzoate octaprenyltransferase n=1 Tax=Rhodomicrobium lacus TaxID=2498452 RepID=UPI0026E21B4F|nr:4-hydroxybenzoate octaprenyltransferase [Rhodomicrobium lacus]WKW49678.1 4-hydroxybenzoate octaprenyltransferase [Rhodomicrobium lacus]